MKTYKVNEIFESFQGEGLNTGKRAIFIRLSGCNLDCSFCDTKGHEQGEEMTIAQIVHQISTVPGSKDCLIVITGGEPMLQGLSALCNRFKELGYKIAIETNCTIYEFWLELSSDIFVAAAPKSACFNEAMLNRANEVKIVISDETAETAKKTLDRILACSDCLAQIWLQPESNKNDAILACAQIAKSEYSRDFKGRLRVGHQMHKIRNFK